MRVLFVKLGALGDVSYALPAPAALKWLYPHSHMTWVVGQANRPLIEGVVGLDAIVEVNESCLYSRNPVDRVSELRRLKKQLHGKYDVVLLAHRATQYAVAFRMLCDARIVQLQRKASTPVVDRLLHRQSVVVPNKKVHESHAIRRLLEEAFHQDLTSHWSWDYSHIVDTAPNPNGPIVMHLGGGENIAHEFRLKKWPHFEKLIQRLQEEQGTQGLDILLVGSQSEAAEASQLAAGHAGVRSLAGETSIAELVTTISQASLFVGPDSGPLHLADSLGVPCIGLFGPTSTVSWGVLGEKSLAMRSDASCSPCYNDDGTFPSCPYDVKCMKNLAPEDVVRSRGSL